MSLLVVLLYLLVSGLGLRPVTHHPAVTLHPMGYPLSLSIHISIVIQYMLIAASRISRAHVVLDTMDRLLVISCYPSG